MMKRVLLAMLVAALVAGCGNTGPTQAQKRARAQEKAAAARLKAVAEQRKRQTAIYQECKAVAGKLDDQLVALDSRMSVGLQFAEYGDKVGTAKVAYDAFIRDAKARGGVSDQCINRVGIPLESGLNAYLDAYQAWNKCIGDYNCSIDKGPVADKMQKDWTKAGRLVTKADAALSKLRPAGA